MFQSYLGRTLLLLGVMANIGLLAINASPERPHLSKNRSFRILMRASNSEADWIKKNQLEEFANAHDLCFTVETAPSYEAVLDRLKAEAAKPSDLLLVDMNDERADDAMQAGLLRPLADGATPAALQALTRDDLPEALRRGHIGTDKLWMVPTRSAVDVAIYLRPAVEDAYLHWEADREKITAALRAFNGVGLPVDYALERTPDNWDSYDLFVASWYWAHHDAPWAGAGDRGPKPRIALRTGKTDDALRDLLTTFYAQGATDAEIAAGKADIPPIVDALQWQALWVQQGVVLRGARTPDGGVGTGVDSEEVATLLSQRQLAWTPASAELSFQIHGGARADAPPGVESPSDLGWATLPKGVSLELADGHPARSGKSFSFQEVYFWAAPKSVQDIELAFRLARFLTEAGLQQREAEALGRLPIRNDLLANYPILFRLSWMQDIFDASFVQLAQGTGDIPDEVIDQHLDDRYWSVRRQVVFQAKAGAPLTTQWIAEQAREVLAHPP